MITETKQGGMGKTSRLYQILVSDKNEEDKKARREGRTDGHRWLPGFPHLPIPFHRLSKGIRRSFRRVQGLGSRLSWGKTFVSNRDSAGTQTTETPLASNDQIKQSNANGDDLQSLDSGLESDPSLDAEGSLIFREDSLVTGWVPPAVPTSFVKAADIVRKSSNRSSRTIDSGVCGGCSVLSRTSSSGRPGSVGGCSGPTNVLKTQQVPKKRVSILLPGEQDHRHTRERTSSTITTGLFKPQLRVETTQVLHGERTLPPTTTLIQPASILSQRHDLVTRARHELTSLHSECSSTLQVVFQPRPDLAGLDSDQIASLLFDLRTILFRHTLAHVQHFEVCLFLIQVFLAKVSRVLASLPGMQSFPSQLDQLIDKSERLGFRRESILLKETQSLYIDLWCCLLRS